MISQKAYNLILKYSRRYAKYPQDVYDIAQEACLLLILNPSDRKTFVKSFYVTLAKRGSYNFYYKPNKDKNDEKVLKNQDVLVDSEEEFYLHPDEVNLEHVIFIKQFKQKLKTIPMAKKERIVLQAELNDEVIDMPRNVVSAHRNLLIKRLKNYFS